MSTLHPERRRRAGAIVAILAGGSVAARGVAQHFDKPGIDPLTHRLLDIASAAGIVLLVVAVVWLIIRPR